jgi:nicotinamide/nicotinate riboside kinase
MIIGIGGISNAGKSTLARRIKNHYSSKSVSIICQDDYAVATEKIPTINDHADWERPESINFSLYEKVVKEEIEKSEIVIIEGIFAFYKNNLLEIMDKKIYLNLDNKSFIMRKKNDFRWGQEPDWYIEHIWKSHYKYCYNNIPKDALVINANNDIDINVVLDFLSGNQE